MGTRTIGLDDEAYERLDAIKRENESFSDAVKRITATVSSDWRRSFGKYAGEEGEWIEEVAAESRSAVAAGMASRQADALGTLTDDAASTADEESSTGDGQ